MCTCGFGTIEESLNIAFEWAAAVCISEFIMNINVNVLQHYDEYKLFISINAEISSWMNI